MDRLSTEIVAHLCAILDPRSIRAFRLTCRAISDIGRPYICSSSVTVWWTTIAFQRLVELSQLPQAPLARAIHFMALGPARPYLDERSWLRYAEDLTYGSIEDGLPAYQEICRGQEVIWEHSMDLNAFRESFPYFTGLRDISIEASSPISDYYGASNRHINSYDMYCAFSNLNSEHLVSTGCRQLKQVLTALSLEPTPRPLRKLSLNDIHWSCFDKDTEELKQLFKPLAALDPLYLSIEDGRDMILGEGDDQNLREECRKHRKFLVVV
ncbi:hypothetical protein PG990_000834 [Apiospora arundinis]|uniref:F-box domain-containing protein n=1 Tax=Apiospora arundinis TaxID=335852 RepID=A0ABR2I0J2_9PEZI